jgi:maltose alpha-D-glucosyltransferase / alpha-amylase
LALAAPTDNPDFSSEPFTDHYRQGLYHGLMSLSNRSFQLLRDKLGSLPETARLEAKTLLAAEDELKSRFATLRSTRIDTVRIRHHGDFHLGQVLYNGQDFIIIDFEGEPARALSERRLKRSPIRDVAGMLRSFQYAAYAALFGQVPGFTSRPEATEQIAQAAEFWTAWVGATYLKAYLETAKGAPFIPKSPEAFRLLLDTFLIEKGVYEVAYELNNRPDWVRIPLSGLNSLLGR